MIYGDATLHTDYIRFFPLLQRLVGGGRTGQDGSGRASACSKDSGLGHGLLRRARWSL